MRLNNDYVTDEEMREAFINCDWVIVPYNSASQSGIIIDAYKSGYLVEAGDNKKFADKLKEAVKLSIDEFGTMSRYAYQYGSKKYATSGAVERFVKLFENGDRK